ncbi:MAG: type IV pilus assembly protein PilM [Nitrospinaceae bacterium]|nr:type IV pilus assembly protein PilM [Nitrospinaceae bacterium]
MFLDENTPLVAVDIGSHSAVIAQLNLIKGRYELMNLGVLPLEEESVVGGVVKKPDEVVDALKQLVKAEKIQCTHAVTSVAGEAVITKKIKVPVMSEEELAQNIAKEAEQYIPFDIDDVRIDFQVLGSAQNDQEEEESTFEEDEDKMEILLVAVQNEIIESRADVLVEAGLKPVIVDLDAFAMVNALSLTTNLSSMGAVALIDLGDSFTHLNIVTNGVTSLVRDIPMGGGYCSRRMMSKLEVPFKQTAKMKRGELPKNIEKESVLEILTFSFEKVLEEMDKSFEFFSTSTNEQVKRIFICGGGALISGVDNLLTDHFRIPVEIVDPLKSVKANPKKFDQEILNNLGTLATVAIGLATRRFDYK